MSQAATDLPRSQLAADRIIWKPIVYGNGRLIAMDFCTELQRSQACFNDNPMMPMGTPLSSVTGRVATKIGSEVICCSIPRSTPFTREDWRCRPLWKCRG